MNPHEEEVLDRFALKFYDTPIQRVDEVKDFILQELRERDRVVRSTIEGMKVENPGKPDTELTYPHYEFGYRAGTNQVLDDLLTRLFPLKEQP